MLWIDADVLASYLSSDSRDSFRLRQKQAAAVMENAQAIFLSDIILFETVYVLEKLFGYKQEDVAGALMEFVNAPEVTCQTDKAVVLLALNDHARQPGCSIADCLLGRQLQLSGDTVFATFNTKHFLHYGIDLLDVKSIKP